jgi:hypothetical protein
MGMGRLQRVSSPDIFDVIRSLIQNKSVKTIYNQ